MVSENSELHEDNKKEGEKNNKNFEKEDQKIERLGKNKNVPVIGISTVLSIEENVIFTGNGTVYNFSVLEKAKGHKKENV